MKTESRKTDPYDPNPVIQYAAIQARKTDKPMFVVIKGSRFACDKIPTTPNRSHWKVDPDGSVFAHLGGMDCVSYKYEQVSY